MLISISMVLVICVGFIGLLSSYRFIMMVEIGFSILICVVSDEFMCCIVNMIVSIGSIVYMVVLISDNYCIGVGVCYSSGSGWVIVKCSSISMFVMQLVQVVSCIVLMCVIICLLLNRYSVQLSVLLSISRLLMMIWLFLCCRLWLNVSSMFRQFSISVLICQCFGCCCVSSMLISSIRVGFKYRISCFSVMLMYCRFWKLSRLDR